MTDCQCPSHVAKREAADTIAALAEQVERDLNDVERLRAGIRALSDHASQEAEHAIKQARRLESTFNAGKAAAYAAMAEQLEALLTTEIRA